jgi:hypothetical protein
MRPTLLTKKPINSINLQEIGDNLNRIENLLSNRKEDQKQISSSINKSTKQQQQSSITSTPAKSTTGTNVDHTDKNQLFNQESFLFSINSLHLDDEISNFTNNYLNQFKLLISLDDKSLDFNYIAEGCRDTRSFQIKELMEQQQSYILIEINESSIKIKNCSNESESRFKLRKIFSFSNREHERSRFIKLEKHYGRPHEINFHIYTEDLNLFKDNSKNLKHHLKPYEVSLSLTISSCTENYPPQQQKSFLNQIEVKFILGYIQLSLNPNSIGFLIEKKVNRNQVEYEIEERNKLVSISKAGNVPIKLKCYLLDKMINENLKSHSIRVNSEFISFEEFNTHKNLDVVLEKKHLIAMARI